MKLWNSPKTRYLLPAIGGLALVGLGSAAAIAKPGSAKGPGADGRRGGFCAKIECTDAQREEVKQIKKELRADSKADREAIKRLHQQMAAEFAKDSPDEAAMRRIAAQVQTHEQELRERGFDAMMEIHALLDAEQRATMAKVMEHRGPRALMHGGRRGKHGKHGKKGKRGGERPERAPV
ncbi:MAG: Spy/CpxP family protein refolding chaperone [Myxococcota bacterium]